MTAPAIDMTPKGLINQDGNYILQHGDVYKLLKYVWAGVLLPVDAQSYQERLDISTDTMVKLEGVLKDLVAAYATTKSHCVPFKDTTYPSIVSLADDVYSYAQNAGGTVDDSYYAQIFKLIRQLPSAQEADQAQIRQSINGLIDVQLANVDAIVTKVAATVKALTDFENECMSDQSTLTTRNKAVKDRLDTEVGQLAQLETSLDSNRRIIRADEAAYEKDVIIASTTVTYAWLFPIGTAIAIGIAVTYGKAAAKLESAIGELKKDITDEVTKIQDEKRLIADLNCIGANLTGFLASLSAAIQVVQELLGIWQGIGADLSNLRGMVNKNVRTANAAIAGFVDEKLVGRWNDLAASVDKYRQAAYVTPIQQSSLDEFAAQIQAQANKGA
ncbi:uncharacterized protein SCHCODRAFT_02618742 [Schizophyllum commune H4-8]|uniref:Pesticidal crystal protein cry6Aa n=1 Tax=Schizophyllum commune (strain H4-8 / FGSC 9210) TaxID=578458 RepID=D8Q0V9_SCHCM|nr:uncharacterized protein SCHCODRAFT_02618742 [Schizophyllum commune H4-8]KAI5895162.1 hypothetical protein SCHCODRAFT_02618742 [Schizophyllum commune H4-8]